MKDIGIRLFSGACGLTFFFILVFSVSQPIAPIVPEELEKAFTDDFMKVTAHPKPHTLPVFFYSDLQGAEFSSADFNAPLTVINFWATFCAPCITELPSLKDLDSKFEDIGVIAISLDPVTEPENIAAFMKTNNIDMIAGYWDHKRDIRKNLPARGLPTTLIVNSKAEILYKFEGEGDWASPAAYDFFNALLTVKK